MYNETPGPIKARLTATLTAIAGLISLLLIHFGADVPAQVIASAVALVAIVVSYFAPRWAEARGILLDGHPAAVSAALTALIVWFAPVIGITLSDAEAVVLVSGITVIVGSLTPRTIDPYPYNTGKEWSKTYEEAEAEAQLVKASDSKPRVRRERRL